jgi:hypothetical protein
MADQLSLRALVSVAEGLDETSVKQLSAIDVHILERRVVRLTL